MSKPKVMDYDTDWKDIIENELAFMVESEFAAGADYRYSAVKGKETASADKADARETVLKGLVQMAAYN